MLIAQITDLHIKPAGRLAYRRIDTAAALRTAVAAVNALDPSPDVVLVTGDLVDVGAPEEYALLRDLLAPLARPWFLIPGNHDERVALAAAFADRPWMPQPGAFVQYALDEGPVRILMLDTLLPGSGAGVLCADRLDWLEARLEEEPGRPTLIAMHHPPFRTGIGHMDRIGLLEGAGRLEALVRRHPNVERIVCGHLHRPIQVRFGGTIASTAPSVAHQVALDLTEDGPANLMLEPPAYQLHWWDRDAGRLVSHTAYVAAHDGPYPFFDGGRLIE